jgi:hypothetical protein
MLNLEVQSKLEPDQIIDRALSQFKDQEGMGVTELVSHLHREEQALDIALSNVTNPSESRIRLSALSDFAQSNYGYGPTRRLVHFDDTGDPGRHVVVDVQLGRPNRVVFQSDKADEIVRSFARSIS